MSWHERPSGEKLVYPSSCLGELGDGGGADREPRHRQVPGVDAPDRDRRAFPHPGHHHDATLGRHEIGRQVKVVVSRGVEVHVDLAANSIPPRSEAR